MVITKKKVYKLLPVVAVVDGLLAWAVVDGLLARAVVDAWDLAFHPKLERNTKPKLVIH